MTTEPKPYPPDRPINPYYTAVGRVCAAWAIFELRVNRTIWELANVEQYAGACITAQFIAPAPRLLALAALFAYRQAPQEFIDELNQIISEARGVGGQRNRIAHDPAYMKDGEFYRFEITADRTLTFGMQPGALEKIREVEKKIRALIQRYDDFQGRALAALPPFSRTQFLQSPGIEIGPLRDQDIG